MDSSENSSSSTTSNEDSQEAIQLVDTSAATDTWKNDPFSNAKNFSFETALRFSEPLFQCNTNGKSRKNISRNVETKPDINSSYNPECSDHFQSTDKPSAEPQIMGNDFGRKVDLRGSTNTANPCFFSMFDDHFFSEQQQSNENKHEEDINSNKTAEYANLKAKFSQTSLAEQTNSYSASEEDYSIAPNPNEFQSIEVDGIDWINEYKRKQKSNLKINKEYGIPAVRTRNSTNLAIRKFFEDPFTSERNSLLETPLENHESFEDNFTIPCSYSNYIEKENQESNYARMNVTSDDSKDCFDVYYSQSENEPLIGKHQKSIQEKVQAVANHTTDGKGEAIKDCQTITASSLDTDLQKANVVRYPSEPLLDRYKHNSQLSALKTSKSLDRYQLAEYGVEVANQRQEKVVESDNETLLNPLILSADLSKEDMQVGSGNTERLQTKYSEKECFEEISRDTNHSLKSDDCKIGNDTESLEVSNSKEIVSCSKQDNMQDKNISSGMYAERISKGSENTWVEKSLFKERKKAIVASIPDAEKHVVPCSENCKNNRLLNELDKQTITVQQKQKGYSQFQNITDDVVSTSKRVNEKFRTKSNSDRANDRSFLLDDDLEMIKLEISSNYYKNPNNTDSRFLNEIKDTSDESLNSHSSNNETRIVDVIRDIDCNYYQRSQSLQEESNSLLGNVSCNVVPGNTVDSPGNKYRVESSDDSEDERSENLSHTIPTHCFKKNHEHVSGEFIIPLNKTDKESDSASDNTQHNVSSEISLLNYDDVIHEGRCYGCLRDNIRCETANLNAPIKVKQDNLPLVYLNEEDDTSNLDLFRMLKEDCCSEEEEHSKEAATVSEDRSNRDNKTKLAKNENNKRIRKDSQEHKHSALTKLKYCVFSRFIRKYQKRGSSWCEQLSAEECGATSSSNSRTSTKNSSPNVEKSRNTEKRINRVKENDEQSASVLRAKFQDAIESRDLNSSSAGKTKETRNFDQNSGGEREERHQKQKSHFWQRRKQDKQKVEECCHNELDDTFPPEMTVLYPRPSRVPNYEWTAAFSNNV